MEYNIFQSVILYTKVTSVLTSRLKRSQNDWTDQFRAWDSLYCNHLPNKLPLKAKEWEAKKDTRRSILLLMTDIHKKTVFLYCVYLWMYYTISDKYLILCKLFYSEKNCWKLDSIIDSTRVSYSVFSMFNWFSSHDQRISKMALNELWLIMVNELSVIWS